MSKECLFKDILTTCKPGKDLINPTQRNKDSFISASLVRQDGKFPAGYFENDTTTHWAHKNSILTYKSKDHIDRYLKKKRKPDKENEPPRKSSRVMAPTVFDFEKNCLFCGEVCYITNPDPKNPSRWEANKGHLCATADRGRTDDGVQRLSFKEVILQVSLYIYIIYT